MNCKKGVSQSKKMQDDEYDVLYLIDQGFWFCKEILNGGGDLMNNYMDNKYNSDNFFLQTCELPGIETIEWNFFFLLQLVVVLDIVTI